MDMEVGHRMELLERKELRVTGVSHVESFTDTEICVETAMGFLVLVGEGLHITQLSLEEGSLIVEGHLSTLQYQDDGGKGDRRRSKGILKRILK